MTADVSSFVRILNGYLDEQRVATTSAAAAAAEQGRIRSSISSSNELITRDLFGGGGDSSSSPTTVTTTYSRNKNSGSFTKDVVDLDLEVPSGWEKRLDLKSGKVYLQRSDSPISSTTSSSDHKPIQDLNLNILPSSDDNSLDLKLVPSYDYGSVCTLDKVKSALERAAKAKKRSLLSIDQSTSSRSKEDNEEEGRSSSTTTTTTKSSSSSSGLLFAGGCPKCLMYVMISKTNPKCPRCNSVVPTPPTPPIKKPKLDLNLNLLSSSW